MNRRTAVLLAGGCALYQLFWLIVIPPVLRRLIDGGLVGSAGIRLLGVEAEDFGAQGFGSAAGWVPQSWFVVAGAVLAYAVVRAAPGLRLRIRTVAALTGALLLAAGSAELLARALDTSDRPAAHPYGAWFVDVQLHGVSIAPAIFALWTSWLTVFLWGEVWVVRRWRPMRQFLGTPDDADAGGEERVPVLSTRKERRDAVLAGLIPVVLLAAAGGQVLRHTDVHEQQGQPSVTFDPELSLPYRPPALIDTWSGVLYPALRLRPLATENSGGWLATLVICLVMLAVLVLGLRAVARSASRHQRARTFMNCWYVTLLAAASAALAESLPLRSAAPRPGWDDFVYAVGTALADAVRFGTVWGWATGAVFLGAAALLSRRSRGRESPSEEGRLNHVG